MGINSLNPQIFANVELLSLPTMSTFHEQLALLEQDIINDTPQNPESLEQFRIKFLGSKGLLKQASQLLKDVPVEGKKEAGMILNQVKKLAEEKFKSLQESFNQTTNADASGEDLSLPSLRLPKGNRHPIRLVENKIVNIFERMGFTEADGPEIEDDWHNFTSLNLSADHPARDMQDTFYVSTNPDWVLRTHTSSVQARVMDHQKPPIRIICPGRVYRNETISARAHCFFHQVEGLYIDEKVSFGDLKLTLYHFVKEMFGDDINIRFRPSYFPFTEPSAEMDISCTVCKGKGCALCKQTGWVEILGCGMVHPNVLRNFGIDPEKYTGFAFGMGIERITQIKFRVNDLRLYAQNDLKFLRQFQFVQL
jgi:phenylalanyl-tRNA synthetase alpha chain